MSRAGTIARRTFLLGSTAVAGGVAFGIWAYKRTPENPLLKDLGDGQAALTPYVRVDQTGVTIITPRADLGQGIYSVLAALVAEELDLAWGAIAAVLTVIAMCSSEVQASPVATRLSFPALPTMGRRGMTGRAR